jgi:hypothetical protein
VEISNDRPIKRILENRGAKNHGPPLSGVSLGPSVPSQPHHHLLSATLTIPSIPDDSILCTTLTRFIDPGGLYPVQTTPAKGNDSGQLHGRVEKPDLRPLCVHLSPSQHHPLLRTASTFHTAGFHRSHLLDTENLAGPPRPFRCLESRARCRRGGPQTIPKRHRHIVDRTSDRPSFCTSHTTLI